MPEPNSCRRLSPVAVLPPIGRQATWAQGLKQLLLHALMWLSKEFKKVFRCAGRIFQCSLYPRRIPQLRTSLRKFGLIQKLMINHNFFSENTSTERVMNVLKISILTSLSSAMRQSYRFGSSAPSGSCHELAERDTDFAALNLRKWPSGPSLVTRSRPALRSARLTQSARSGRAWIPNPHRRSALPPDS